MGKILVVSQRTHRESDFLRAGKEENEMVMDDFWIFQVDRSVNADILRWAHVYCVEGSAMKPVQLTLTDAIKRQNQKTENETYHVVPGMSQDGF